jgi:acetyl esterase/lipase
MAVLAGEWGHALAGAALLVAVVAWVEAGWTARSALGVAAVAAVLLLKPSYQAYRAGRDAARALDALDAPQVQRRPFSLRHWLRPGTARMPIETLTFSAGLEMDLYRPAPGRRPAPCVLVVHGGGWDSGTRQQLVGFNHWMAARGYAVAAISYRLAPAHPWPAQREDVRAALACLQARAAPLGLDTNRVVLLGRSAGGQIALNAAYTLRDPSIRGVIGLYAPADLHLGYASGREDDQLGSRRLLRQYLGGTPAERPEQYDDASATTHVAPDVPPTLLVHGALDTLVWNRHTERLAGLLASAGVPHAVVRLPWATHAIEVNLNGPGGQVTSYAVERFLARATRAG